MIRLDLGCGRAKQEGFVGVDRFPLPGVDIVADLARPLPFRSDSVDLVVALHGLEHVANLIATMQEVYRVCRDGARICIVAPYFEQKLNLANPYHLQAFNEHTPRFWTNASLGPEPREEYAHPHASGWGLARSDNSDPGIDLRCESMEFFYFPEYRGLSEEEKRKLRRQRFDVCDQILYQLVVHKPRRGMSDPDEPVATDVEPYEPAAVTIRRLEDRLGELQLGLQRERAAREEATAELARSRAAGETLGRDLDHAHQQRRYEVARLEEDRDHRREEAEQVAEMLRERLKKAQGQFDHELKAVRAELRRATDRLLLVESLPGGRWLRALQERLSTEDARLDLAPTFRQLEDDSLLFLPDLAGFRLQPSAPLHEGDLHYSIDVGRPGLAGLRLAVVPDANAFQGLVGLELRSPEGQVLAESVLPMSRLETGHPAPFDFPPLRDSDPRRFTVRLFARETAGPVRVLEWRRFRWRLGPLERRPFAAYRFGAP